MAFPDVSKVPETPNNFPINTDELPDIKRNENENAYVSRCVSFVKANDSNVDSSQATMMCSMKYRNSFDRQNEDSSELGCGYKKKRRTEQKSLLETLASVKRLFERNGYAVSDDRLLELTAEIQQKGLSRITLSHSLEASNETQTIKVFPKKKVYVSKYKEALDFNDNLFDEMIQNFEHSNLSKPFGDEEHKRSESWCNVERLYKDDDGLYADIRLNKKGYDRIKNEEFMYISPEWGDRVGTDGKLYHNVLCNISLTNIPALEGELPSLQEQMKLEREVEMDSKKLDRYKAVIEAIEGLDRKKLQEEMPAIDPSALMELVAKFRELVATFEEMVSAKGEAEAQVEEMQQELSRMKMERDEIETSSFFEKIVSEGKLHPAEVDDYKVLYRLNKEKVVEILEKRPVSKSMSQQLSRTKDDNMKLSDEDREIMRLFGKDPDESKDVENFIKANKEE